MLKKIIAVMLAVLMVMAVSAVAVSAADTTDSNAGADANNSAGADTTSDATGAGQVVKFDAAGWKNFNTIFCHIWIVGGQSFYGWQAQAEKCEKVIGTTYQYDLSALDASDYISGGLKSGEKYCIIFSADTGVQTYDTTFGTECIGDTAYLTGEKVENPVDSKKSADECVWENNSSKYGPHFALTSIGNIVGDKLAPGENAIQIIGDWIPTYYLNPNVDAIDAMSKAFPKLGIKDMDDIEAIYAYVLSKETGEDEADILRQLQEAIYIVDPSLKGQKVDTEKAKEKAEKIESGEVDVTELSDDTTGGDSSGGGSDYSGDGSYSGSGDDGQETTIFFILIAVMMAAAGVMFVSRKRED